MTTVTNANQSTIDRAPKSDTQNRYTSRSELWAADSGSACATRPTRCTSPVASSVGLKPNHTEI